MKNKNRTEQSKAKAYTNLLYPIKHFVWLFHLLSKDVLKWCNTLRCDVTNTVHFVRGHNTEDIWMPNGLKPFDCVFSDVRHFWRFGGVHNEHRHVLPAFLWNKGQKNEDERTIIKCGKKLSNGGAILSSSHDDAPNHIYQWTRRRPRRTGARGLRACSRNSFFFFSFKRFLFILFLTISFY